METWLSFVREFNMFDCRRFGQAIRVPQPKKLAILLFSLLLLCCMPGPTPAQEVPTQILQGLSQNAKLGVPGRVLEDFSSGKTITRVIVTYRGPNASTLPGSAALPPAMQAELADRSKRKKVRQTVEAIRERVIGTLITPEIRITNRFQYLYGFSAEVSLQGLQRLLDNPDIVAVEKDEPHHAHLSQGLPLINGLASRASYDGSGLAIAI